MLSADYIEYCYEKCPVVIGWTLEFLLHLFV